jgi:hypothetical protein
MEAVHWKQGDSVEKWGCYKFSIFIEIKFASVVRIIIEPATYFIFFVLFHISNYIQLFRIITNFLLIRIVTYYFLLFHIISYYFKFHTI